MPEYMPESEGIFDPTVAPLIRLADWQEDNLAESRKGKEPGLISSKGIRDTAAENQSMMMEMIMKTAAEKQSRSHFKSTGGQIFYFTTLHYFMDEFDSQPTVSEFSASKLKTFINSCYENAPRIGAGNSQSFVQLVIAMNKSWDEFTSSYGLHVARRIAEMCVRIDFDNAAVTEPTLPPSPPPPPPPR